MDSALCSKRRLYENTIDGPSSTMHDTIPSETQTENHTVLPPITGVIPFRAKNGSPTFAYKTSESDQKNFHSIDNPEDEARQWADNIEIDLDSLIVILGGGFFYHVRELINRLPGKTSLIIIEREQKIIDAAKEEINVDDILQSETIHLFVGNNPSEAIEYITKFQMRHGFKKMTLLSHLPSVQTFSEFYQPLIQTFTTANNVNIVDRLRYTKFAHPEVRVLLLTTRYFLMGEIISAMKRLDMPYRLVTIKNEEVGCREFMETIIKNILDFKPDFIFTINHMGIDREGILTEFFTTIEMPLVSWYVDNPNLVIANYHNNATPFCVLLLWDKNTVSDMQRYGFEHTCYLPLGVDENRFHPIKPADNPFPHLFSEVSFVGNSMVHKTKEQLKKAGVNGSLGSAFQEIARDYLSDNVRHVEEVLQKRDPSLYNVFLALTPEQQTKYKTAVSWEATKMYRLERIERLLSFRPLIVGDSHWLDLLDNVQFQYHRELSYYDELPFLYNQTAINFNATSRQMKGAVNQRVFDVPACNAFLLTDFQEQMSDLFEIGKEVICYHSPEEIEELTKFYLDHEENRKQVAQKGYERVLKDHTYVVRVKKIVQLVKKLFSSSHT